MRRLGERLVVLVDAAGLAAGTLEPVEQLGGRVDLVVVLAAREDRQLVQVFGEPAGLLGQVCVFRSIVITDSGAR